MSTRKSGLFGGKDKTSFGRSTASASTFRRGECLGLVGESGSGKTTVSKILMRAVTPDTGSVTFDDGRGKIDVLQAEGDELMELRTHIQMVFQDPVSSLSPRMTVQNILSEPLEIHGRGDNAYRLEKVRALMQAIGLDQRYLNRYPHSFSGGQRQRIGIARALALGPQLLDLRRTRLSTGCFSSGANPQSSQGPAEATRADLSVYFPQPCRCRLYGGPYCRHVWRTDCRNSTAAKSSCATRSIPTHARFWRLCLFPILTGRLTSRHCRPVALPINELLGCRNSPVMATVTTAGSSRSWRWTSRPGTAQCRCTGVTFVVTRRTVLGTFGLGALGCAMLPGLARAADRELEPEYLDGSAAVRAVFPRLPNACQSGRALSRLKNNGADARPIWRNGPHDHRQRQRYPAHDDLRLCAAVGYDEHLVFQPDILEAFQSENDTVFTFTLREGHKWSDGSPLTADDFRYWWDDVLLNKDLTPGGGSLICVSMEICRASRFSMN